MRKMIAFLALAVSVMLSPLVKADISLSLDSPTYTQNFNSVLASTGTSNSSVPEGWSFLETGTGFDGTYAVNDGGSSTANTYSYGTGTSTDRAFGSYRTNNLTSTIGMSFEVAGPTALESLSVSYMGEMWRLSQRTSTDRLDFQFSIDATSLSNGTWTDWNPLDFISPNFSNVNGSTGARDGNATANRSLVQSTILFTTPVTVGANLWLRWNDFNVTGNDDGLAIDDFSMTGNFAEVPEPAGLARIGILAALVSFHRRRFSFVSLFAKRGMPALA